jgi:hypothetical protein
MDKGIGYHSAASDSGCAICQALMMCISSAIDPHWKNPGKFRDFRASVLALRSCRVRIETFKLVHKCEHSIVVMCVVNSIAEIEIFMDIRSVSD